MARDSRREAACYSLFHLTNTKPRPPDSPHDYFPELRKPIFPIIEISEWEITGYLALCTWEDCYDGKIFIRGKPIQGTTVMPTPLSEDEMIFFLLDHLKREHGLHHVVPPYEPYGKLLASRNRMKNKYPR